MKRAAFLFGSGISRLSQAPMVGDISEALLNRGWHDEGNFRFSPISAESTGTARSAQEFLRVLKNYIDPHLRLRENREAHYEDLYAAAMRIFQDEISEIVDPMLRHSVIAIRSSAKILHQDQKPENYPDAFAQLVHSAILLIHWSAYQLISSAETPVGMEVLTSVAKATRQMDIFSLNHDLLIERQLEQSRIQFSDGFSEKVGDVIRFNWSWNNYQPVRLYKLHGSLDWYRFIYPGAVAQFAKVRKGVDPRNCQDGDGNDLYLPNPVPLLLIGTNGKERLYGVGFVGEFFYEFRNRLAEHQTLICCGYGWCDHGINNRLSQWLFNSRKNRIIILHKDPLDKLMEKRFWSDKDFLKQCMQSGQVMAIPKWLSDCTLIDLEPFFDD